MFHNYKKVFEPEEELHEKLELTRKQKQFMLRMYRRVYNLDDDKHVCAFPIEKDDGFGGTRLYMHGFVEKVHIHHILPKGFAYYVLGWDVDRINSPYNLIPICPHHHMTEKGNRHREGDWDLLHPDMVQAFTNYNGTGDSFKRVFSARKEMMERYEMYHNPDFDALLLEKASYVYDKYLQMQLAKEGRYIDIFPS